MSNTRRNCHPEHLWAPSVPAFDAWNETSGSGIKTRKHQEKDRPSGQPGKHHKFTKGLRNRRYNLARKIDNLRLREALE